MDRRRRRHSTNGFEMDRPRRNSAAGKNLIPDDLNSPRRQSVGGKHKNQNSDDLDSQRRHSVGGESKNPNACDMNSQRRHSMGGQHQKTNDMDRPRRQSAAGHELIRRKSSGHIDASLIAMLRRKSMELAVGTSVNEPSELAAPAPHPNAVSEAVHQDEHFIWSGDQDIKKGEEPVEVVEDNNERQEAETQADESAPQQDNETQTANATKQVEEGKDEAEGSGEGSQDAAASITQVDKLLHELEELTAAVDQLKVFELPVAIQSTLNSILAKMTSLAALAQDATCQLSELENLSQTLDSQSNSMSRILSTWAQQMQRMQSLLQEELCNPDPGLGEAVRYLPVVEHCLITLGILSTSVNTWKDQLDWKPSSEGMGLPSSSECIGLQVPQSESLVRKRKREMSSASYTDWWGVDSDDESDAALTDSSDDEPDMFQKNQSSHNKLETESESKEITTHELEEHTCLTSDFGDPRPSSVNEALEEEAEQSPAQDATKLAPLPPAQRRSAQDRSTPRRSIQSANSSSSSAKRKDPNAFRWWSDAVTGRFVSAPPSICVAQYPPKEITHEGPCTDPPDSTSVSTISRELPQFGVASGCPSKKQTGPNHLSRHAENGINLSGQTGSGILGATKRGLNSHSCHLTDLDASGKKTQADPAFAVSNQKAETNGQMNDGFTLHSKSECGHQASGSSHSMVTPAMESKSSEAFDSDSVNTLTSTLSVLAPAVASHTPRHSIAPVTPRHRSRFRRPNAINTSCQNSVEDSTHQLSPLQSKLREAILEDDSSLTELLSLLDDPSAEPSNTCIRPLESRQYFELLPKIDGGSQHEFASLFGQKFQPPPKIRCAPPSVVQYWTLPGLVGRQRRWKWHSN